MTRSLSYLVFFLALFSSHKPYAQSDHLVRQSPSAYTDLLRKIRTDRDSLNSLYKRLTPEQQPAQLNAIEDHLIRTYYTQLLPEWIGTKWEFYGETQHPRDSSIACGHFVVTTLKHLGIRPEHSHEMATDFSAYMVHSLCDSYYTVYKADDLIRIVEKHPDDIWVVGIHNHSGLLVKYKGEIRFVHSSYTYPTAVVDESATESDTFQHSTIYVAGNLFKQNCLTEKWLKEEEVQYVRKFNSPK